MSHTNRRDFMKRAGLTALAGGILGNLPLPASSASLPRPNILILAVDQMRFRELSTMPDNPARATIQSLLPNIMKLQSAGNPAITDPANAQYNPGNGVSFTNYFGAATCCTPARAAWVTGLYAPQTRMYDTEGAAGEPALDKGFPTWGSILTDTNGTYGFQSLGYSTAWIGKWHLSNNYGTPSGLSSYGYTYVWPGISPNGQPNEGASGGVSGYGTKSGTLANDAQISANFAQWLSTSGTQEPWCTTVSFINPHDMAGVPLTFGTLLDPANAALDMQTALAQFGVCFPNATTFPQGGFTGSVFDGYFSQGPIAAGVPNYENVQQLSGSGVKPELQGATMAGRQLIQSLCNADGSRQTFTSASFVRTLDIYLWLWAMVDAQIGEVLSTVWSDAALTSKTVIVFTSDHGEFGGSHGMLDKSGALYDEGIHIPLNVWFPWTSQSIQYTGTRSNPCSAVDFCPLILSLASGGEQWRQNNALAHLRSRLSIFDMLSGSNGGNTRPYTLTTTDELRVDEGTPNTAGGQHHLIAYRDTGGKFIQSSYWQPCTDTIDPTQPQFFEFYDYAMGNNAEIGNDSTTSPNYATYSQNFTTALAAEFVLPPVGLSAPYARALTNYLTFASSTVTGGGCAT